MNRRQHFVQIGWILAIEQHEETSLILTPPSVQLNKKAMRLSARDEVVVNSDALSLDQLVGSAINSLA